MDEDRNAAKDFRAQIQYGPFPVRGGTVAALLAAGTLGLAAALGAATTDELHCARLDDGSAQCLAIRTFGPVKGRSVTFDPSRVDAAELVESRRRSGPDAWTRLVYDDGSSGVILEGPPEWARDRHAAFRAFLDGDLRSVTARHRPHLGLVVPAIGCGIVLLLFLAMLARQPRLVAIEAEPERGLLRVVTKRMLLPPKRESRFVERAVAVEVRHATEGRARRRVGRLSVVLGDGGRQPVTEEFLPGTTVHDEAGEALGRVLDLPVKVERPHSHST